MFGGAQILVTGGTGFIGRYVVRRLLAQNARVRLFCRDPAKARRLFADRVAVVPGDLRERDCVATACQGVNVIVHVAGVFQFGRRTAAAVTATNVAGTRHLLEAARHERVTRFIHVSSSGVLENRSGGLVGPGDFPAQVSRREPYRRSKWLGELAALGAAREGFPVTIASPTSPIGAEDEAPTPTGQIIRDFLAGQFPFSARVGVNWIHVDELAAGILAVAARGRIGQRYVLGHHNLWLDTILEMLARCTGRSTPRWRLPLGLIALAGLGGEVVGSGRVCWETAAHARRRQWFDFSQTTDELGWQPQVPLETSIREAIAWFARSEIPARPMVGSCHGSAR